MYAPLDEDPHRLVPYVLDETEASTWAPPLPAPPPWGRVARAGTGASSSSTGDTSQSLSLKSYKHGV